MKLQRHIHTLALIAMLVSGCSTRPRPFVATLAAPAASETAYQSDLETCRTLVRKGVKTGFKDAAVITGVGVAGAAGAGAAVTGAGLVGIGTSGGAAAAATAGLLIVPLGLGFGVSRLIRSGREKKYKAAMGNCLAEHGYSVSAWTPAKKVKTVRR